MAAMRGSRLPVGSAAWIAEERDTARQIARSEVDEFAYSARNDFEWLNEHMAEIFNENEMYVVAEPESARVDVLTRNLEMWPRSSKPRGS